ncbi:MAG: hypothetical protein ACREJ0_30380 [Geminicoccaceae bacterium]
MRAGYGVLAAVAALIATVSVPGTAAAQSPTVDRVWAGCELTAGAVTELNTSMGTQLTNKQIAFVVIHSFQENNGQERTAGGFTGPVICTDPDVDITEVQQTTTIPSSGSPVDLLDQQSGMSVLYRDPSGSTDPDANKKRFCWTVTSLADCFDFE